ncbi:MAG: AAA family ATPase, partial [Lachnospiraceae bacterium]|nr:AAA family ATPase [Lachnospiraceae bacterium]
MGIYFNTGTKKFNRAINSKIYIDKTGFLAYTNSVIDTEDSYICLSRPRRFGKSITAAMLAAYYGKGFDSSALFDGKKIALSADYKKYMNKYDIIEVDLNVFRRRIDP